MSLSIYPWGIEAPALESLSASLDAARAHGQVDAEGSAREPRALEVVSASGGRGESVAVIPIRGPILRGYGIPWLRRWGFEHVGQQEVREHLREALASREVSAILLDVDSPGGVAVGIESLADELRAAGEAKPLHAFVGGMAASAAYFLASQAKTITAEPDAIIGSIGTYAVVTDSSREASEAGRTVHVVRSGEHKGMGVSGAPVTPSQLAMHQELIDSLSRAFTEAVARGRGLDLEAARALSTGAHWAAREAMNLGLVDQVGTRNEAISSAGEAGRKSTKMSSKTAKAAADEQATTTPEPPAPPPAAGATLAELEAECPGASAEFYLGQIKAGATLAEARRVYMAQLRQERDEAKAQAAKAAEASSSSRGPSGADPLAGDEAEEASSAQAEDFYAMAKRLQAEDARFGGSYRRAASHVAKARPDLHAAYVDRQRALRGKPTTTRRGK